MKSQGLFSLKKKKNNIKMLSAAVVIVALRVNSQSAQASLLEFRKMYGV